MTTLRVGGAAAAVPVGAVIDYAGSGTPAGYLECTGQAVSRTGYPALFAAIGTTWGSGDGSTTFNVPDFRGRTAIGAGTGTAGGASAHALASYGGDERLQSHQHTGVYAAGNQAPLQWTNGTGSIYGPNLFKVTGSLGNWDGSNGAKTTFAGGGSSQNMQPFATVRKLIRAA